VSAGSLGEEGSDPLRSCQRRIFSDLSIRIDAHFCVKALPGRLGMWSDLLVAFLISMPALIYGAIQWLTYLQ
jgi:hypothetical protein